MSLISEFLSLMFILAIVYMLVKPSSLGPDLIKSSTSAFAQVLTYATQG